MVELDCEGGVEHFKAWITEKYLDKEVVKVGEYLTEFCKQLRKGYQQDICEFNTEFNRRVSKLREVGCFLPDICVALPGQVAPGQRFRAVFTVQYRQCASVDQASGGGGHPGPEQSQVVGRTEKPFEKKGRRALATVNELTLRRMRPTTTSRYQSIVKACGTVPQGQGKGESRHAPTAEPASRGGAGKRTRSVL